MLVVVVAIWRVDCQRPYWATNGANSCDMSFLATGQTWDDIIMISATIRLKLLSTVHTQSCEYSVFVHICNVCSTPTAWELCYDRRLSTGYVGCPEGRGHNRPVSLSGYYNNSQSVKIGSYLSEYHRAADLQQCRSGCCRIEHLISAKC